MCVCVYVCLCDILFHNNELVLLLYVYKSRVQKSKHDHNNHALYSIHNATSVYMNNIYDHNNTNKTQRC